MTEEYRVPADGVSVPVKRKRKPAAKKPPANPGRKTLIAAISAMLLAGADFYMTIRYGLKLF